jgi:hypothetical protein
MPFGLALLLGGPVLCGSLAAQTAPLMPVADIQPGTSCSIAIVPTRECFRHSDLLLHNGQASAKAPDYRLLTASLGWLTGLLVGAQFPKEEAAAEDSAPVAAP